MKVERREKINSSQHPKPQLYKEARKYKNK
jgi:hypothetical protein